MGNWNISTSINVYFKKIPFEIKILKFMPKQFYRLPVKSVAVHTMQAIQRD
jgi:hypothetical protein